MTGKGDVRDINVVLFRRKGRKIAKHMNTMDGFQV
jgi:hypothetical protein